MPPSKTKKSKGAPRSISKSREQSHETAVEGEEVLSAPSKSSVPAFAEAKGLMQKAKSHLQRDIQKAVKHVEAATAVEADEPTAEQERLEPRTWLEKVGAKLRPDEVLRQLGGKPQDLDEPLELDDLQGKLHVLGDAGRISVDLFWELAGDGGTATMRNVLEALGVQGLQKVTEEPSATSGARSNQGEPVSPGAAQHVLEAAKKNAAKLPWRRGRLMLMGKGRGGKTATARSLMGKPFDPISASTVGAETANLEVNRTEATNWSERQTGHETADAMAALVAKMRKHVVDPESLAQCQEQDAVEKAHKASSAPPSKAAGGGVKAVRAARSFAAKQKQFLEGASSHAEEAAKQLTEQMVSGSDDKLTFSMWDCGGQQVFYSLIHLFFSRCAVYLCIFDMRDVLSEGAREEALETVAFWLHSVHLQAPGAPVILVGTFGDVVTSSHDWEEIERILLAKFPALPRWVQPYDGAAGSFWFFPLDNTKKHNEVVSCLRVTIERAAIEDELNYINREIPVIWRQVLDQLHGAGSNEKREYMTIDEVMAYAAVHGVPDWQVDSMLSTFHELGAILYFTSLAELKTIVILQPQWLIDATCRLICDFSLHENDKVHGSIRKRHPKDLHRLKSEALATKALLDTLWRDYDKADDDRTCRDFFLKLLQELVLICPLRDNEWLVPGLMQEGHLSSRSPKTRWMTFWLDFGRKFLPPGLFSRLICLCAELCSELGGNADRSAKLGAEMTFGSHKFRLELEDKMSIRVDVADSAEPSKTDGGPVLVLRQVTSFLDLLKNTFMKNLEFEIRLGAGDLARTSAPTVSELESVRLQRNRVMFRPQGSKKQVLITAFDAWFQDGVTMPKSVRSQWVRLCEEWPFLKRGAEKYDDSQKVSLHRYLQDPAQWGITWESLEQVETEARSLPPYLPEGGGEPIPYEEMSMWHIVQTLVKPVCSRNGAPLALVYNEWHVHKVEAFVSHCWAEPFAEFMDSLRSVYRTWKQKPVLFICAFALYQGTATDVGRQLAGAIKDAPFVKALKKSQHFVAVRNRVEDIYTRAWCLVELVFARKLGFFSQHVSITGPNTHKDNDSKCIDLKASVESDRRRVLDFLLENANEEEIDQQIQEFREYDAGFENYHSLFVGAGAAP